MPYIDQQLRDELNDGRDPHTAGELNYVITRLAIKYVQRHGLGYQQINDVRGAINGALVEFERRLVAPYEDRKIVENGDAYPSTAIPA